MFFFFYWADKNFKKKSKNTKFVINLPKIIEKDKKSSENDPNNDWNWSINSESRNLD